MIAYRHSVPIRILLARNTSALETMNLSVHVSQGGKKSVGEFASFLLGRIIQSMG